MSFLEILWIMIKVFALSVIGIIGIVFLYALLSKLVKEIMGDN